MDTQIKKFGRQEIAVMRLEIQSALDGIKNKFGLMDLSIGTITFREFYFTCRITATVPEYKVFSETYAEEEAKFFAIQHGISPDVFQKKFVEG
ncbi:MAG: hypothetical protein FJY07_04055 [Bacteroidetes bacterium]|nr:hypothetical protein [Bacteroidota bacterium]